MALIEAPPVTGQQPPSGRGGWASDIAGVGFGLSVLAMIALQLVSLDVRNPLTDTLSSYAYAPVGALFGFSLISLAVGTAALVVMAGAPEVRAGPGLRAMLGVASLASLGAALFRADPRGYSAMGEAHRYFSIALMVAVPVAALAMLRRGMGHLVSQDRRRIMLRLILASAVAGGLFLFAQLLNWSDATTVADPDAAAWGGGISQRVLVGVVFALLVIMCSEVQRIRNRR